MKEHYKFDKEEFRELLGKNISSISCTEDFRYNQGATVSYQPYYNRFEGIQNLVLWYIKDSEHFTIKLYTVDNGRFSKIDNGQEKQSHYGLRSIGVIHNNDLNFRKSGSIYLKPSGTFGISTNNERITKISFYQEVPKALIEESKSNYFPKFRDATKFPDRIVMEGEEFYLVIRAEEDYDQNLFLIVNIGYKFKTEENIHSSFTEPNSLECILIDEIQLDE